MTGVAERNVKPSGTARLAVRSAVATALVVVGCASAGDEGPVEDGAPLVGIEQDLRIDGYEADLVPVQWLGVSSTGRIALLQWQDYLVKFFDESGAHIGSVGREGEGPGEFRRLVRAGWIGDTLWVSDTQLQRATLISPELRVVGTIQNQGLAQPGPGDTARFASYASPSPYAIYHDRTSLAWALRPLDPSPNLDPDEGSPVFRLSRDGIILNQVALIPSAENTSVIVALGSGGSMSRSVPFAARRVWVVSPHGSRLAILTTEIASSTQAFYRVYVTDPTGSVVFDKQFPFVPEPIPDALRDSAITASASRADSTVRREVAVKLRDATPHFYAAAEELVIGSDDRIWVGMRPTDDGTRWLVLSPTGDPTVEVLLPRKVRLRAAGPDHVWCVERDDLDVESVVRYRLVSGHDSQE